MRIPGIASGLDTEAIVKSMMAVERMKVDKFEKNRQTALWRQESYNTMNKAFANFILNTQKDMGLKKTSSTGSIANSSYKNVDYVKKATSSNEAAATVSSTGSAVNGSYKIDIEQLAKGASFSSAKLDGDVLKDSNSNNMKELEFTIIVGKDEANIDIIKTIKVENDKGITMDDVVKSINDSKIKMFAGKVVVDGKVGGVNLTSEQLKEVKEVSLEISAFYDKANGRLFMQSKEMGKDANFTLGVNGNANGNKFIASITNKENKIVNEEIIVGANYIPGQNAKIKLNDVVLEYSSNNIKLNGLDIELKDVTSTNPISINVSTNTQGIMEKVEKLVKDYNDLIDLASKSLTEKAYAGYKPLTAEERKAMSESDVKLWDEKAKSGLLNRDETIERILQSIRNDLYKTVDGLEGDFNHITKIGIATEPYARGSAGGKLVIDKDKLQKAIEANPDAVMDLLFTDGKNVPDSTESKFANGTTKKGIFTNIYDNLITGMKAIVDKSGPGQDSDLLRGVNSSMLIDFVTKKSSISDLDKAVQDMNKQIDSLNVLLARKEDSYYAKFTAMEKNMHKMNGQSGWLQQQFG